MAASDSDDDDSFVVIGTAFDIPDKDEPRRKKIQVEDLPAKDSRGRTRFHGAFTGGFSAGYFNTAGSKEGWTPSTFSSSKSQRAESSRQRPEDYMDEEDLGEHGIAPRTFTTTDSFVSTDASRKRVIAGSSRPSVIPGDWLLTELIVPDVTPIGVRLLRKMGWRDGQGIGPRQKKKIKQKDTGAKVYGCALPPSGSDSELSESGADYVKNLTFAPKDTTPIDFTPKDNYHGIGYSGLNPKAALQSGHLNLFETEAKLTRSGKRGIKGQAFGVGALEEDDDDVYTVDHLSNYHQTLGGDEEDDRFGWTAPKGRQLALPGHNVSNISRILEGFQLSSKQLVPNKVFPPPRIPPNYRPIHIERQPLVPSTSVPTPVPDRKSLNSLSRGLLLGEVPLMAVKAPPQHEQQQKGTPIAEKVSRFSRATEDKPANLAASSSTSSENPPIKQTPAATSSQYKPFSKDPAKQTRYDQYQALLKLGVKDPYSKLSVGELTEWEKDHEREEFTRAASLYKPLSAMMASRFTTAKYQDDLEHVTISGKEEVEKSDDVKAAEMKMFGKLTREVLEWHPDKVLCKRFNIPDPYPDSQIVGLPGSKRDKFSVFNFLNFPSAPPDPPQAESTAPKTSQPLSIEFNKVPKKPGAKGKKLTTANIFAAYFEEEDRKLKSGIPGRDESKSVADKSSDGGGEDSKKKAGLVDTSTTASTGGSIQIEINKSSDSERPPMDVFKAIFQDSDSESSSDEKGGNDRQVKMDVDESVPQKAEVTSVAEPKDGTVNPGDTVPGPPSAGDLRTPSLVERLSPQVEAPSSEADLFGPCLPPQHTLGLSSHQTSTESSSNRHHPEDVRFHEKPVKSHRKHRSKDREKYSHRHKKKKTKNKKSKHKKDKKKNSKRRKSSSGYEASTSDSEAESSDGEVPSDSQILHRLKQLDGKGRLKAADFM
ncbi:G patch domain-containing protein 1-like [Liolophura sinensis]|uniref:G patch domain-containing protein 1-like n=1 Tax=Liolophura sinensis TaxID=3198878 RepID=UPI0031585172